jgi:hypothetical protein
MLMLRLPLDAGSDADAVNYTKKAAELPATFQLEVCDAG